MGFLRKYLDTKQVQENEIENLEQGGVPSVPSVPSELEFPARLDKNWSEEIEENEDGVFQEVFQVRSKLEAGLEPIENLEELPQTLIDWLANPKIQAGDQWPIPEDLLPKFDVLVNAADSLVRRRDLNLRIWRGQKSLQLKVFFGPDPPPLRKRSSTGNRFRTNSTKRIQTMWSPEEGWLHWDEDRQDYVAQPASNTPKDQGEEMSRAPD